MFPQIWDLADPEGKGFLDKQVFTRIHRASGGARARAPTGWVTPALPSLLSLLTSVTRRNECGFQTVKMGRFRFEIKVF